MRGAVHKEDRRAVHDARGRHDWSFGAGLLAVPVLPGVRPGGTPVECPLGSEPVDGVVTGSPIVNTGQNRIYVATNVGTVYNFAADNGIS